MNLGSRIRFVREEKKLSQGDLEKRTGLLRCYISRVENGHTVPSIETLEKIAGALEMKLYQLLYDGDEPPKELEPKSDLWGSSGKEARFLGKFRQILPSITESNRKLLLFAASRLATAKRSRS
jgi:transcriptional regulator with XRE-family HTH domain